MSATRKRPRPEPAADLGPRQRVMNGTAVLIYRADPERPHAPAIRAAKAYVAHEALHARGLLSDAAREAAERILIAAEAVTGARHGDGGGLRGRAPWQCGGVTQLMVQAAADLRDVGEHLDRATSDAVMRLVCDGAERYAVRAAAGLSYMARVWGLSETA